MNLELLQQPIHPNVRRFIVPLLRKRWIYWPARGEAIKQARTGIGAYKCNICKRSDFKREELQVDHIDPVQEIGSNLVTWYDLIVWITRLFVDVDKLQCVCKICHAQKTLVENEMRKHVKKQNRKSRNRKKRRS